MFVNYFENLSPAPGYLSQQCITAEFCGKGLALEHNGDVFSCDHYVYPDYQTRQYRRHALATMAYLSGVVGLAFYKRDTLPTVLPRMSAPQIVLGRVSEKPLRAQRRWRSRANYLCHRIQMYYDHALRSMPDVMRRIGSAAARRS